MKFNTDRIVSLSAMVVGLGSLFTVLYQTHLTRQAQHASVLPYLSIALMANDEGVYVLLNNSGIGPALIDEVRIHRTGRQTVGDPYDFYVASRPDSTLDLAVDKVLPGRLIPAGASIRMLGTGIAQRQKGPRRTARSVRDRGSPQELVHRRGCIGHTEGDHRDHILVGLWRPLADQVGPHGSGAPVKVMIAD